MTFWCRRPWLGPRSPALCGLHQTRLAEVVAAVDAALSGVAEHPVVPEVVGVARRVNPDVLRSLDAIHLASALLLDVDLVVTYDERLAAACAENGLVVSSPLRVLQVEVASAEPNEVISS